MAFNQFPQKGGIPSGNTAARPSSPAVGDTYYNGQLALLEIYDGTNWVPSSAPPGIPTVTATDIGTSRAFTSGAVTFSFVAGVNGGNPYGFAGIAILGGTTYTTGNTTASSATISVGGPGTYSVSGTAYNGFGASPSSVAGNLAVTTVPDAPTGVSGGSVTASSIVVSWTAPATGGKAISQYTVTPFIGATAQSTTTTSSTSVTVTGLTSGTSYTFKVKATNANGTGLDSTASASVATQAAVDFLVVAGGGGGGGHNAGGGGAGGLRSSVTASGGTPGTVESAVGIDLSTNYTVTVGNGGAGGQNAGGTNGSNSVFSSITSTGGGGSGGGNSSNAAQSGGSGGGAVNNSTPGAGTANQGYAGGQGSTQSNSGTGGGGAGAAGLAPGGNDGGNGGAGVAVAITGTSVTYAGGGGGSSYAGTQGQGGAGGGGTGAYDGGATAGSVNTGGGGGGNNREPGTAGAGGRGVVILKYPSSLTMGGGSGLTSSTTTSGSFKITTFTQGTGTVSWS